MKRTLTWVLAVVLFASTMVPCLVPEAKALDPVSAATFVAGGVQGLRQILNQAGISRRKAVWIINGMKHTWWICVYQDGTQVANNFRSYRTEAEVMEYYTGQNEGDCDAIVQGGGHVCYGPNGAARMVNAHGRITNVYPAGPAD
jgi:hypothetical protein